MNVGINGKIICSSVLKEVLYIVFNSLVKNPSAVLNRQYMVDALGLIQNPMAQDLLVDLVLKSPNSDIKLIDSVLIYAVARDMAPSQVSKSLFIFIF